MEEEVIVYKLVAAILPSDPGSPRYISLMGDPRTSSFRLHPDWITAYEVGVWAYPPQPGSKLFAYRNLGDALRAAGDAPSVRVFKSKATGIADITTVSTQWYSHKSLRAFWDRALTRHMNIYHAITCDKIILLEEVQREEVV